MTAQRRQAGDTLIEVLLATVILSVVVTAAYTISNRASRINISSNERAQASEEIRKQAELLNFFAANEGSNWTFISGRIQTGTPPEPINDCVDNFDDPQGLSAGAFDFNGFTQYAQAKNYTGGGIPGNHFTGRYKIWINAFHSDGTAASETVDYYINACWEGIGGDLPQRETVVYRIAKP